VQKALAEKKSVIDLKPMLKNHFGEGPDMPSLGYFTQLIWQKKLDKYQQLSNWKKKSLYENQVHYAALDAYILLKMYEHIGKKSV